MRVALDYLAQDGYHNKVSGTALLFDGDNLRCVEESPGVLSQTLLFSFDGAAFNGGGTFLVKDAYDQQEALKVLAHGTPGQDIRLVVGEGEEGAEVGCSGSFELRATAAGIVIADDEGRPLAQWLKEQQSWYRQGRNLGPRLRFAIGAMPWERVFVPSLRERLSPLAERLEI